MSRPKTPTKTPNKVTITQVSAPTSKQIRGPMGDPNTTMWKPTPESEKQREKITEWHVKQKGNQLMSDWTKTCASKKNHIYMLKQLIFASYQYRCSLLASQKSPDTTPSQINSIIKHLMSEIDQDMAPKKDNYVRSIEKIAKLKLFHTTSAPKPLPPSDTNSDNHDKPTY